MNIANNFRNPYTLNIFVRMLLQLPRFGAFIDNFEHISQVNLMLLFVTLTIHSYKHSTCIPRWNDVETNVSTSFLRGIHVECFIVPTNNNTINNDIANNVNVSSYAVGGNHISLNQDAQVLVYPIQMIILPEILKNVCQDRLVLHHSLQQQLQEIITTQCAYQRVTVC